jgi:hypothetical protein
MLGVSIIPHLNVELGSLGKWVAADFEDRLLVSGEFLLLCHDFTLYFLTQPEAPRLRRLLQRKPMYLFNIGDSPP